MKHRLLSAIAVICGSLAVLTGEVGAQMKDLKKLRLNVFRIDAATAVARAQGLFAAEGLEVEATVTPNSTDQMRGISQGKYEMVSTAFDNVLAWSGREGTEIVTKCRRVIDDWQLEFARPASGARFEKSVWFQATEGR